MEKPPNRTDREALEAIDRLASALIGCERDSPRKLWIEWVGSISHIARVQLDLEDDDEQHAGE